jgi:hypothetical protein
MERRSTAEMLGEFLREAAVLVAVFMPLDLLIRDQAVTLGRIVLIMGISGGLLAAGVTIERVRRT